MDNGKGEMGETRTGKKRRETAKLTHTQLSSNSNYRTFCKEPNKSAKLNLQQQQICLSHPSSAIYI